MSGKKRDHPTVCIAVGDPHFQASNVIPSNELIDKLLVLIQKIRPAFVVVLGDILHMHEKVHVTPLSTATRMIKEISAVSQLYVLMGNHDYINNQQFLTDKHAFNSFKSYRNVEIVDKVLVETVNDNKFVFCPYVPPDRFQDALETVGDEWKDADCIFAHQEFYGCHLNPAFTSTEGDIWPENYPLVVSGHIHNEERLQSNVYYPGSSMQHSFGETHQKIVAGLTFRQNTKFQLRRFDLQMRKKRVLRAKIEDIEAQWEALKSRELKDTDVKIILSGNKEQFKVFRRGDLYKKLLKSNTRVSFVPDQLETELSVKTDKREILSILEELIVEELPDVREAFDELIATTPII